MSAHDDAAGDARRRNDSLDDGDARAVADVDQWAAMEAADAVDAEDAATVEAIRAAHPDFDDRVARYRDDLADFASAESVAPPAGLRDSVMSSVRDRPSANEAAGSGTNGETGEPVARRGIGASGAERTRRRPGRRSRMMAAATMLVVAAVAGTGWWLTSGGADDGATGDDGSVVADPTEAPPTVVDQVDVAGGRVWVERSGDGDDAVVRLTDVPAPDPGSAYQMWLVGETGNESVGVMENDEVTDDMTIEIDDVAAADAIMISVEPSGGSAAPSGALVDLSLRG
ncbi:anti-sigma factor [uncultured Corynebacterium sp.]|uniref:anti-sigma factor n=1 Tax=uncultured Corynebacterium sp. TaxID=159447 RepID=UPI0025E651A1|nr:anti-sigma factor [uncultured Corynebacterium sp.]